MKYSAIMTGLLLTFISINIFAHSPPPTDVIMKSYLNWKNMYGGTNAGRYDLILNLSFNQKAAVELKQELSDPPSSDQPGSEPPVCYSFFTIDVGTAVVQLKDVETKKVITQNFPLKLYFSHYDDSEVCTSADELLDQKNISVQAYYNLPAFNLNYQAPLNYARLKASISIFPFSNSTSLKISRNSFGDYLVEDLSAQLKNNVRRNNKEGVSSYVYAESADRKSTLSLGSAYTELK